MLQLHIKSHTTLIESRASESTNCRPITGGRSETTTAIASTDPSRLGRRGGGSRVAWHHQATPTRETKLLSPSHPPLSSRATRGHCVSHWTPSSNLTSPIEKTARIRFFFLLSNSGLFSVLIVSQKTKGLNPVTGSHRRVNVYLNRDWAVKELKSRLTV